MTSKPRRLFAAVVVGVIAAGLIAAGCGSSSSTATTSPSPSPSASSALQKAAALKAYYDQVKPVYAQVAAGVSALDGSVKGLTKKPGPSWTTSANKMTAASQQFGSAVTTLQGVTPPSELAFVQSTVISALQSSQKVLDKTAAYLNKRVYDPSAPDPKTQIKGVTAKLLQQLQSVMQSAVPGGGTPMPTTTP
jgi:hypothetical protein